MSNQVEVHIVAAAQVAVEVTESTTPVVVEVESGQTPTVVEVEPSQAPTVVELLVPGPQGPAAGSYTHVQSSAASVWTIAHNLGFRPSVELLNSASQEIDADIVHLSNNVCIATFNLPITGVARLN